MNNQCSFLSLFKAEHYKTKRNLGVWLIILLPAIIIVGVDLYVLYKMNTEGSFSGNPWITILGGHSFVFFSLLYPLIIAIFSQSIYDVEYKNNSFKQLFTLPAGRTKIFIAKVLYMTGILFISLGLAYAVFLMLGYILSYILPQCGFQDYDVRIITFVFFGKCFLNTLAITFIQFFFSLLFKKMVFPIGIASFFMMLVLVIFQWQYIDFIPYISIYRAQESFSIESVRWMGKPECINMIYSGLFLGLSYWKFNNIKA